MKISYVLAIAITTLGVEGNPERTPGQLRSVVENSGICGERFLHILLFFPAKHDIRFSETTSGVYQASGYGDISRDGSLWYLLYGQFNMFPSILMMSLVRFWFFAARNNPDTAPLVLWFNGGVSD
jgi:hypothetical protein